MGTARALVTVRRARLRVEIARTPWQLLVGLMFRRHLAPDSGMLLCFRRAGDRWIHTLNVRFPLDVLFLRADGVVAHVHQAAPGEWGFHAGVPVRYVLETRAGFCHRHRIRPGDRVRLPLALAAKPERA